MLESSESESYPRTWNYLQSGTIIDQYMIERELAHGGFSLVYLARQLQDQTQVAIKEYLPLKLAYRAWDNNVTAHNDNSKKQFIKGRALFFEEAKILINLKHPNIVEVINFFQANATVYMVMIYDYGLTLSQIIKEQKIPITEAWLLTVFRQLLKGVAVLHANNLLHLDIKPANILLRPGNDPLLLDFGAFQSMPSSPQKASSRICTQGFSPIEQYSPNEPMGPWTDLYAVGATMRTCLELKAPLEAPQRAIADTMIPAQELFKHQFPRQLLSTIDLAMALDPSKRPQSITEMQKMLDYT